MKINGEKVEGCNVEYIVLPRPDKNIVFIAKAILDMSEFDRLCPKPKPPTARYPDGSRREDVTDKRYVNLLNDWGSRYTAYLILKSLEATENLEWETCSLD